MQIQAMLAESIDPNALVKFAVDDDWYIQQKLDGHRILLDCNGENVCAKERHGRPSQHNDKFQSWYWLATLLPLAGKPTVFDGELIGETLWVFDLPYLEGWVNFKTPYSERLTILEGVFEHLSPDSRMRLVSTARTSDEKLDLTTNCIKNRAEGMMVKHAAAGYLPGVRAKIMLKAKFTKTIDCVVTALNFEGRDNAVLCVWKDGELVEVGRCSTIGKHPVQVGDVVEVKYLYASKEGERLVQPTMLRPRPDKEAKDCPHSQLTYTNKTVL